MGYEQATTSLSEIAENQLLPELHRALLLDALGLMGNEGSTESLVRVLRNNEQGRFCQIRALFSLSTLANKDAARALAQFAADEQAAPRARLVAMKLLSESLPEAALPILLRIAEADQNPQIRVDAIESLSRGSAGRARRTLEEALLDTTLPIATRSGAARGLGHIGHPDSIEVLARASLDQTLSSGRRWVASALGWIGGAAATDVLEKVAEDASIDSLSRSFIAEALGRCGTTAAVEVLGRMAVGVQLAPGVRVAAVRALGRTGDRHAIEPLLQIAESAADNAPWMRVAALQALQQIPDGVSAAKILSLGKEKRNSNEIRMAVIRVLGALRDHESAAFLNDVLLDCDETLSVRNASADALSFCGDKDSLGYLRQLAEDPFTNEVLRLRAIKAHSNLSGSFGEWVIDILSSFRTAGGNGILSSQIHGAILKVAAVAARTVAWDAYFREVAISDHHPGNRIIALRALLSRQALHSDTIRRLLGAAVKNDRTLRLEAVVKICVRAIMEQFAGGNTPEPTVLELIGAVFRHPATSRATISFGLKPIRAMNISDGWRAFQFAERVCLLENRPNDGKLTKELEFVKLFLERQQQLVDSVNRFCHDPSSILIGFRIDGETRSGTEMHYRRAILITSTIRERRAVVHALTKEYSLEVSTLIVHNRTVDRFIWDRTAGRPWLILVVQPSDKGPLPLLSVVSDFTSGLDPVEVIVAIGCCAGFPERGVCRGDVIIARRVHGYQRRRHRGGIIEVSTDPYPADPLIVESVNYTMTRPELNEIADLTLHFKDFASAEDLIDDPDSSLRGAIQNISGEIVGFEMEGQGLAHGLWEASRRSGNTHGVLVKTVSDFGDGLMSEGKDETQIVATRNALRFTLELLRSIDVAQTASHEIVPGFTAGSKAENR
jgi:HEAT repeat protein